MDAPALHHRDIGEAGLRIMRHRLHAVRAVGEGIEHERLAVRIARRGILDRAAGRHVDPVGPVDLRELLRRHQLARLAVDHIIEAVLRRVDQHRTLAAIDDQIGQLDVHRIVEVPGVAGIGLVMPGVLPGLRIQRDDRGEIEIVAAAGRADLLVPRKAVTGADVDTVVFRVIGHRLIDRAAAAELPPFAGPGGGRLPRRLVMVDRRVAGDDIPAPRLLAGIEIVGGDIAAHRRVIRAAEADHHLVAGNEGRAGDIAARRLVERLDAPQELAILRIDREQAAVARRGENLAVAISDAADAPAGTHPGLRAGRIRDARIILPQQLAGLRVERVDHAVAGGEIEHAVHRQRCGIGVERVDVVIPGEAEPADVCLGDLGQWAIMLLAVVAAEAEPVAPLDRAAAGGRPGLRRHGRQQRGGARQKRAAPKKTAHLHLPEL